MKVVKACQINFLSRSRDYYNKPEIFETPCKESILLHSDEGESSM